MWKIICGKKLSGWAVSCDVLQLLILPLLFNGYANISVRLLIPYGLKTQYHAINKFASPTKIINYKKNVVSIMPLHFTVVHNSLLQQHKPERRTVPVIYFLATEGWRKVFSVFLL